MMRLLEEFDIHGPMGRRLSQGVLRMNWARAAGTIGGANYTLRGDQVTVFNDVAAYLKELSNGSNPEDIDQYMGRIILPPRTGKTVIAAHSVEMTGLTATMIEPTKQLVDQTVAEFRAKNPHIPVGAYFGDEKKPVEHGVNVSTYKFLQGYWQTHRSLPPLIRNSALIFPDEAHHAMTPERQALLRYGFDPRAVRIALTASPNYSDERKLAYYFPNLIHEITIEEAIKLDLLAPARVYIYEVDVDASQVEFRAGDFEDETTGRLMSAAPFLEAACKYRYQDSNRNDRALICCRSRQQAYDLYKYLLVHRPEGTPEPGLIVNETPKNVRRELLRKYELGYIDTLISVSILIEGWSCEFCKLLIDLSPNLSLVRATQKFFRPMTKWAENIAKIYILLPKNMPVQPIFPFEIMGWSQGLYLSGDLIASEERRKKQGGDSSSLKRHAETPIKRVRLKTYVVVKTALQKPELDPRDPRQLAEVLLSNEQIRASRGMPNYFMFRWMMFNHRLFIGRGEQLMRYAGVPVTYKAFMLLIARVFPDRVADQLLFKHRLLPSAGSCYDDLEVFNQELLETGKKRVFTRDAHFAFCALAGLIARGQLTPEESMIYTDLQLHIRKALATLTPREEKVLRMRFGIGEDEHDCEAVGVYFEVTRERIRQIEAKALRKLRHPSRSGRLELFVKS